MGCRPYPPGAVAPDPVPKEKTPREDLVAGSFRCGKPAGGVGNAGRQAVGGAVSAHSLSPVLSMPRAKRERVYPRVRPVRLFVTLIVTA